MTRLLLPKGRKGFSVCEMLIAIAVIMILMGMMAQGFIWVKYHAEVTALTGRANHFATALQLYYQNNGKFPRAYPAHLDEDLAPYIEDSEFFSCPTDPTAGAAPLNNSYVTPIGNDGNRYVLSIDSRYDTSRAIVLYADATAEVVKKLPVQHNGNDIKPGSKVTGGSLAFDGGSSINLSNTTAVTVVKSFRAEDGTPYHIVKQDKGSQGSLTAVAVNVDVIEVANDAALTFLRGGVADVKLNQDAGEDFVDVSNRSGELIVDGKITYRGDIVDDFVDDNAAENGPAFTIDDDHNLVVDEDCIANIRVLGKAITYGTGGPDCAVQCGAKIGNESWQWLFSDNASGGEVFGGEAYSQQISAGTRIAVQGRATYGNWSATYQSTQHHRQVMVLVNGDTPPQFEPFDHQPEITDFCAPVIDAATGRITIEGHQALFLFELGTTNMQSPAADFQDLVVLVDFARLPSGSSDGPEPPPADDPPAPEQPKITLSDNNLIKVPEDGSLGVRVLGTSLRKSNGQKASIALSIKVNDEWDLLRKGQKMYSGYRDRRQVSAGSTIALKARSYQGSDSTSHHSADGSGHVLTCIKDETPSRFNPDNNPPALESYMAKAMNTTTHQVNVANNQVLMLFELKEEDADDPDARFQDIAVVLTFTPASLHEANTDVDFDGYSSSKDDESMGTYAQAYADQNDFDWVAIRQVEDSNGVPEDDGPPPNVSGLININPNNNNDFEFTLEKRNGSVITRDDLLASDGQLTYENGPAVRLRFKPKGNGNQNSMTYNGQPYVLHNKDRYTITSDNMTVHLYNDHANAPAMGRWWMQVTAVGGTIIRDADVDDSQNNEYTEDANRDGAQGVAGGRASRSLGRGTTVGKGRRIKAVKYN